MIFQMIGFKKFIVLKKLEALYKVEVIITASARSYLWQNKDNLLKVEKLVLYAAIPSITLEVILVYFFRVVLAQYRSIKAQLLQLELRAALCQFIEKYAEFAAKTTEAKAPISEKFESLIFSGILANEDQIPSTFDGVEQFAKLIDALKSKGGK